MSDGNHGPGVVAACLAGAAALYLLDLVLSVALAAIAHLSRVAVRRLSQDSEGRLSFLEDLKIPHSTHRMATQLARQASLLGGSGLVGLAASNLGAPLPFLAGILVGVVVGVLAIETFAARSLAQRDPRSSLRITAPLLRLVHLLVYPVVAPLAWALVRVMPAESAEEGERDEEQELDALIEVGEREGLLEANEGEMVRSIVDLSDTSVREVMTPRTDIDALPASATVADARRTLAGTAAHTRMPVYRDTIDNVVGILHVRDLVRAWEERREDAPITDFLRPAFFVPETMSVAELLAQMRQRTHIALVVDEYGGTAGLVTMENLLEEIVGDIRDEHDVQEALIQPEGDGVFIVSGLAHVEQLEELFGLEIGEREFDTVGGLVVWELGRVPAQGENLASHGLRIEVVRADRQRVYKVRVKRTEGTGSAKAAS